MRPRTTRRPCPAGTRRVIAAVTVLVTACASDEFQRVTVEPTPASGVVNFVLADRNLLYGLTVSTCRGRDMWTISNEQLGEPPAHISYGVTPPGFVSRAGPTPLKPGCYVVTVSGPSRARFHIGTDGRVSLPGTGTTTMQTRRVR